MKIKCRYCGKPFKYIPDDKEQAKHFPFCSEQCKLADLGKWFDGDYSVSEPLDGHHGCQRN
jgi:uncharacterized protein